ARLCREGERKPGRLSSALHRRETGATARVGPSGARVGRAFTRALEKPPLWPYESIRLKGWREKPATEAVLRRNLLRSILVMHLLSHNQGTTQLGQDDYQPAQRLLGAGPPWRLSGIRYARGR